MTSVFSWQNYVFLCHASFCTPRPNLPVNMYSCIEKVKVKSLSRVQLFATPWTVAYQAPLSMGFSRQQFWSGLPFPSPGDLPNSGIEPESPALQADALTSEPPGKQNLPAIPITALMGIHINH